MDSNFTCEHLMKRLDDMHGASFDSLDASHKLSCAKQNDSENSAMFAERISQLVVRAYPSLSRDDQQDLFLRAFLQGLTTQNNIRFKMNKQMFSSFKVAIEYGTHLELAIKWESGSGETFATRSMSPGGKDNELVRKVCDVVVKALGKQDQQVNNVQLAKTSQSKYRRRPESRPCFFCHQLCHWQWRILHNVHDAVRTH